MLSQITQTLIATALLTRVAQAFELAAYWGQNAGNTQTALRDYCSDNTADIIIVSFVSQISPLTLNLANICGTTFDDGLLHCPSVGADITYCQQQGKKVLLSVGGATACGFASDAEATSFANDLWNKFGAGTDSERPFDTAVVDGFDLDFESNQQTGTVAFGNTLQSLYAQHSSKKYYLAGSPQCPYPDQSVGDFLTQVSIDFTFVQFYNNDCNLNGQFNFDTWSDYVVNSSPNKSNKIFIGLPGSVSSAQASSFAQISTVESAVESVKSNPHFGGIVVWDASSSWSGYAQSLRSVLDSSAISDDTQDDVVISTRAPILSTVSSTTTLTTTSTTSFSSTSAADSNTTSRTKSLISASTSSAATHRVSGSTSSPMTSSAYNAKSSSVAASIIPVATTSTNKSSPSTAGSSSIAASIATDSTTSNTQSTVSGTSIIKSSSALIPAPHKSVIPTTAAPYYNTSSITTRADDHTSTATEVQTTVITITSCSDNKCTEVPVTTGLTTVTDFETSYVTYCPFSSESSTDTSETQSSSSPTTHSEAKSSVAPVIISTTDDKEVAPVTKSSSVVQTTSSGGHIVTTSDVQTTVVTITSCSDNKCTEVPVTTGLTTVTDFETSYVTYCPLSGESSTATSGTQSSYSLVIASETKSSVSPASSSVTNIQTTSSIGHTSAATDIQTTVITVASCSDNQCSNAPITTGLTTVIDFETSYVTYCPFSGESSATASEIQSSVAPTTASEAKSNVAPTTTAAETQSTVAPTSAVEVVTTVTITNNEEFTSTYCPGESSSPIVSAPASSSASAPFTSSPVSAPVPAVTPAPAFESSTLSTLTLQTYSTVYNASISNGTYVIPSATQSVNMGNTMKASVGLIILTVFASVF